MAIRSVDMRTGEVIDRESISRKQAELIAEGQQKFIELMAAEVALETAKGAHKIANTEWLAVMRKLGQDDGTMQMELGLEDME